MSAPPEKTVEVDEDGGNKASRRPSEPLVIVGPTASGKSALAVSLARRWPGLEILSADAMAVYRRMNIGTAKPTEAERALVPHHGVDLFDPCEEATVAEYQAHARAVLDDMSRRKVTPIIVGGTGLYIRAVVDDFQVPGRFPAVLAELDAEPDTEALWRRLAELDPAGSTKMLPTNRRRVLRALEVTIGSGRPFSAHGPGVDHYPPTRYRLAGLDIDREAMDRRIDTRYDRQMAAGMLEEVAAVHRYGMSRTAAQALGYKELIEHLDGAIPLDEALTEAKRRTRKFARRQQRWFRRDPRITWFDAMDPDLVDRMARWWVTTPA
ncbi:MAG: tRNA (adenosine(37)-N6)-dimethylallyltransferase MiaA [Acidimicrobiia bacterium]|nr:tRNA (adenosine(37)-N6)-dimethylallyltransferase MiaA [Acidimicrobiia bacterium]